MKALAALVLVFAAASLAAGVDEGHACSCALPDARSALARADGAFVGTARARREAGQEVVYTFSVERALKGAIGRTVEVSTPSSSAACGIEVGIGTRVGLVLERRGGTWSGSLCAQFEPAELLAAAAPLPAPNGRGPVALVLGGEFGGVRLMSLDARGRTLAYGRGGGRAGLVSFCPGNRRLVEVAPVGASTVLVVRTLPSLRIVRRQQLALPRNRVPERLACETAAGTILVFARAPSGGAAGAAIYRIRDGRRAVLWGGAAFDSGFGAAAAYLSAGPAGRTLLRVDLASGRALRVATLPGPTMGLSVNARDTAVSGIRARAGRSSQLVRVDFSRTRSRVSVVRLARDASGQVFWLRGDRLLFAPAYGGTPARVLDRSLRTVSRFRWTAGISALAGDVLFGSDQSLSLLRADLPSGPQRTARTLPGRPTIVVAAR